MAQLPGYNDDRNVANGTANDSFIYLQFKYSSFIEFFLCVQIKIFT